MKNNLIGRRQFLQTTAVGVVSTILGKKACGAISSEPAAQCAENPMRITIEKSLISVDAGETALMRYRYENVPFKPYVQQLFSPAGINILRDAPHDHLHHHGLMLAFAVNRVNFWEERPASGRQVHRLLTNVNIKKHGDQPAASFSENINWVRPEGEELLLTERRTIKVQRAKDSGATLVSWQSRFDLPKGKTSVVLTGPDYFGLGMRFLQSMDKGGRFYNANGQSGVADTKDKQAKWCAYTAVADGKPVTVAMFDHPDNKRYPATWYTLEKPFAYLSLTMNLHKKPLTIVSGKPLVVQYGVAVWDGRVEAKSIEKLYRQWSTCQHKAADICD